MARWVAAFAVVVSVATVLWMGYPVPGWAVVVFVCLLFIAAIPLTVRRLRAERRLMRSIWNALTGK